MKITNAQKKLIEQLYGKGDFLEVDDILYYKVSNDNTTYRVDFDKSVYKRVNGGTQSKDTTDKKNKIEESDMEKQIHDLTPEQVKENYWQETDHTKIDGSFAMYETRVAKEMESKDSKDREDAKKEVKQKLAQKGVSVINTEDMTDDINKPIDKEEEETEDTEDTEDSKYKKDMEDLMKENEKLKTDLEESKKKNIENADELKTVLDFVQKIKAEREAETEVKRQEKIKQIMTDFVGVTEEKLKDKTLDQLNEQEEILTSAFKKDTEEEEEAKTTDMKTHLDFLETKAKDLSDKYRCDL